MSRINRGTRAIALAWLTAALGWSACARGGAVPAPSPRMAARDTVAGVPAVVRPDSERPGAVRPDSARGAVAGGIATARLGAVLSPELRRRAFDVAVKSVSEGFFDASFSGIPWDSIVRAYRPRALAAERSEPFHETLAQMLAAMHVSHTVVISPERLDVEKARVPGWTGAEVRTLPDGFVIFRIARGSPADSAGLRPGDVVDSISGVSAERIGRAGTRVWLSRMDALRGTTGAVNSWLAGSQGAVVRVVVRDSADRPRAVQMVSAPFPGPSARIGNLPPARATLEARRLEGGIAYLRFSSFVPGLEPDIRAAIRGMRDAPGLVLDLRGNPGGYDELGDHIASLLVAEPHVLTKTVTRRGVRFDEASPVPDGYRGPVVVLIDGLSASASEQFAAPMQEIGRIRVVGERSAGADLEASVVTLPTGGALMFPSGQPQTAAGRVIEGAGVRPDVPVALSRLGLARGRDAQLDAAVAELHRLAAAAPAPPVAEVPASPATSQAPSPQTPSPSPSAPPVQH